MEPVEGPGGEVDMTLVKPHWSYMAPAPCDAKYTADQCLPVFKYPDELRDAHPIVAAYRQHEQSRTFARDEVLGHVRPAYQGLIAQLDEHLGCLFEFMDR